MLEVGKLYILGPSEQHLEHTTFNSLGDEFYTLGVYDPSLLIAGSAQVPVSARVMLIKASPKEVVFLYDSKLYESVRQFFATVGKRIE